MKNTLLGMGFLPNVYDPCVFHQAVSNESITILLYVDDLIIIADTDEQLVNINHLKAVYKEVTSDIGVKHSYLGINLIIYWLSIRCSLSNF
jgi:hypothetical protein